MIDTTGTNTDLVLKLAAGYSRDNNVGHIVMAITKSETALKAAKVFGTGKNIVAVTHSTGFVRDNEQELEGDVRKASKGPESKCSCPPCPFIHGTTITARTGG